MEDKEQFNKKKFSEVLKKHAFFIRSFEMYNGPKGFYDFGAPGSVMKENIISYWRQHFELEEHMLRVDCSILTPEEVFKVSGHVDRFTDLLVQDVGTKDVYRADHLLKEHCEKMIDQGVASPEETAGFRHILAAVDGFTPEQITAQLKEYGLVAPKTKNALSAPYPYSLMFATEVGPHKKTRAYLRPETSQGIFTNFKELYTCNAGSKLPFAVAQVGEVFRNEVAPGKGLVRLREFTVAEIEHFLDPRLKSHSRFHEVSDLEILMLPTDEKFGGKSVKRLRLGYVVSEGIIKNQTLGYYIGRAYMFLLQLGIDEKRLRFRQHHSNELAHYAVDCWDAEIESSDGWLECIGISDRGDFDLSKHKCKVSLPAQTPDESEHLVVIPKKSELGFAFKGDAKVLSESLEAMTESEIMNMKDEFKSKDEIDFEVGKLKRSFKIKPNMLDISYKKRRVIFEKLAPHVVEPGFGIGRIMHCLLEHTFYMRCDQKSGEEKPVFRFNNLVAPYKCLVCPVISNAIYEQVALSISKELTQAKINHSTNFSAYRVGKKCYQADELGIPYFVVVERAVVVGHKCSVTVRERDSMEQIRVDANDVLRILKRLIKGRVTWESIYREHKDTARVSSPVPEDTAIFSSPDGSGQISSPELFSSPEGSV